MASIIYREKNGRKYAYQSESYWDKEKKAPRSRTKYLGVVDPNTGEIIQNYRETVKTAVKEKPAHDTGNEAEAAMQAELLKQREVIERLRAENRKLEEECSRLKKSLARIIAVVEEVSENT
jgi:predicted RNase H-like nuclease (RuvC/YqgF family)